MSIYDTVNSKYAKKWMQWLLQVWQVGRTVEYTHGKHYYISIYSGNIAAWTEPGVCIIQSYTYRLHMSLKSKYNTHNHIFQSREMPVRAEMERYVTA